MKDLFNAKHVDVQKMLGNRYFGTSDKIEELRWAVHRTAHFSGYVITTFGDIYEGRMAGTIPYKDGSGFYTCIKVEDEEGNAETIRVPMEKVKLIVIVK